MLEWLEVRLDVGCDKRLMYEYRIEPLLSFFVCFFLFFAEKYLWF